MFSDTQVSLTSNRVGRISLLNLEVPLFCWHRTFLEVGGVLADSFTFGRLSESDDYRSSPWKILFKTQYNFLGIFYRPIKRQKNICLFPNHQMFILYIFWRVTQLIPTMTDSHHGGFLSVMIMVGICQVTNSHHKWWWRNLFGTIPTKMFLHYHLWWDFVTCQIPTIIIMDKNPPWWESVKVGICR